MAEKKRSGARGIPTPVVLAVASAMVSIGVVAALGPTLFDRKDEEEKREAAPLRVDARTPEAAAESYLDAYRRREHAAAIALSVGTARAQAETRMERDARATEEERAAKEQLWDAMAAPRLALVVTRREPIEGGVALQGRAEGRFLERRYVREVAFDVLRRGDEWRVARMDLGAVLEGPSLEGGR